MKKVLFTATIDGHIKVFHLPYLRWFKEAGYEVHVAAKGNMQLPYCDEKINIPFDRKPFSKSNIEAFKILKNLIDSNNYELIHCHTPTAGVLTRLASRNARKRGTKVIYTAHGFHFYKGAPKLNWLLYFPLEKLLSDYTDVLVTINGEDYNNAVSNRFGAKQIKLVPGVGVDLSKFSVPNLDEKLKIRKKIGIAPDAFVLVYPAEISRRKNQNMLIEVASKLKGKIPNLQFIFAGRGDWKYHDEEIKKRGLQDVINFIGFTYDIYEYVQASDIGISSSTQEGLPINIVEAMACGKPLVATNVRGNRDLIKNGVNGFIVELNDSVDMANKIYDFWKSKELTEKMGMNSHILSNSYSLDCAIHEMVDIYKKVL
jgi:glycosyltransferase EpsD